MNVPLVSLHGVVYAYPGGAEALRGIDYALCPGDRTVLLGPNGSGKSTLFLVMAGVLRPRAGEIRLGGRAISGRPAELRELRSRLGLVFQDPDAQLFANSVAEDVSFGPVNRGLPPKEIDRRVEEALEACGIAELAERPPHALSYGQKKLAAIAGVVATGCEAILLDEPTSGLDGLHAERIEALLLALSEGGTAIHVSTHDTEFALRFGREAILLENGRVTARAAPELLYRERAREFEKANVKRPLIFCAHEALAAELARRRGGEAPRPPRREAELAAWARALLDAAVLRG